MTAGHSTKRPRSEDRDMTTETWAIVIATASVIGVVLGAIAVLVTRSRRTTIDPLASTPDMARRLEEMQTALAGRDGALGGQGEQRDAKLAASQQSVTGRGAALDEQVRGIGAQMQGITSLFINDRARGGW